jgi:phytoene/squalene synthetase
MSEKNKDPKGAKEAESSSKEVMEVDADEAALDLYCRRVAGSVGAMAVRIFGAPQDSGMGRLRSRSPIT